MIPQGGTVVERAASAAKLLISLTCRVKLLQIAPEVADLALLLDAPERHPGAWNLGLWICDEGLEGCLVPGNGVFFRCIAGCICCRMWL